MIRTLIVFSTIFLLVSSFPFFNLPSFNGQSVEESNEFPPITNTNEEQGGFMGLQGGSAVTTGGESSPLSDISFFFKLSNEAKEAFGAILMNPNATKGKLKTAITEWAAKYDVTTQVNSLIEKKAALHTKFRANIQQAVQELPAAIQKFFAIEDDDSLTIRETIHQYKEGINGLTTPYLKALVLEIITLGAFYQ